MIKNIISKSYSEKINDDIFIELSKKYKTKKYKNVLKIDIEDKFIVIFDYGICVYWNIDQNNIKEFEVNLIELLKNQYIKRKEIEIEKFKYKEDDKEFIIENDMFLINKRKLEDDIFLISLSYVLSQDLKLTEFENKVSRTIEENKKLPEQLAKTGKIYANKKELSKKIGELFLVRSKINLHYDLLDTPEFIWEYPLYEHVFIKLTRYLDINPRIEVLNKKLDVLKEILDMLGDEQNHKHSSFLEWIIIILILVEIVLTLLKF